MNEVLLGFHLRQSVGQTDRVWDSHDRSAWLLREDIAFPLSVDEAVWPECNNHALISSIFSNYSHTPELGICNIFPEYLDQSSEHNGGFLIGVTIVNDKLGRADELIKEIDISMSISIEQLYSSKWECLGYDVASYDLISCLTNCGFSHPGKNIMVKKYAGMLNDYGLFSSAKSADFFRIDCDSRIPEHAPFAIYGIWANGRPRK